MRVRHALSIIVMLLVAACDPVRAPLMDSRGPRPIRLSVPDAGFRLTQQERARVAPGFHVDALERLRGMMRPDLRPDVLKHFQEPEPGERPRGALTELFDTELQEVLEVVWPPMWKDSSDEVLAPDVSGHFPGRRSAREHRKRLRRVEAETDFEQEGITGMSAGAAANFDFSEEELFRAFRLVVSSDDARRDARAVVAAFAAGARDWATSTQVMILLSLGSESGNAKVRRIRKAQQQSRFTGWMQIQQQSGHTGDLAELRRQWAKIAEAENAEWEEQRNSLRRTLEEQGKLESEDDLV